MSKQPRLGVIDGGAAYHVESFESPELKGFFDQIIYLRALPLADLSDLDILVVPCHTNPHWLGVVAHQLQRFMLDGGTLMVMGEVRPDLWLPCVGFEPVKEVNFWWWLGEGADLGVTMCAPGHSLNDFVTKADATYHLHSTFTPLGSNQHALIETREGECLMFEDLTTYASGRLVATTLDPFFHHGQFFMPATTRFLQGLLPWLKTSHGGAEMAQAS